MIAGSNLLSRFLNGAGSRLKPPTRLEQGSRRLRTLAVWRRKSLWVDAKFDSLLCRRRPGALNQQIRIDSFHSGEA